MPLKRLALDDVEGPIGEEVDRILLTEREGPRVVSTFAPDVVELLAIARSRAPVDVRITWTS